MRKIFGFGEKIKGFSVKVLNEREIRAGAGILFLFSLIGFLNIILRGSFTFIKLFITFFLLDFIIRVLINPKYSPSLIIGRLIVSTQEVEYVGAPQKKFAWIIGLILSSFMFIKLNILNSVGWSGLVVCIICLIFLFFETSFGICLGCKVYPLFSKKPMELCAGDVCNPARKKELIQKVSFVQILIVSIFLLLIVLSIFSGFNSSINKASSSSSSDENSTSCVIKPFNSKDSTTDCVLTNIFEEQKE